VTPILVKLLSHKGKELNETVAVMDWSSLGRTFLVARANGELQVLRVKDCRISCTVQVLPANMIPRTH
jgi:hypothetical protein